jgi:hypothetical protein
MQYIEALTPPTVMAIAFALVIRTLFRHQGGAAAAREDAVAEKIISAQRAAQD